MNDPASAERASPDGAAFRGALAASSCYLCWGLVPLYWRQLAAIGSLELIAHRITWSLVFVAALLAMRDGYATVRAALASGRGFAANLLGSVLLSTNWLVYVYGVNTGRIVETSLGYFLVPLVNVALGRLVLHEKLRRLQWIAVVCAAAGVSLQVFQLGHLPWIALALAGSWGGYGLLRKRSALGPLTGLAVETLLLAPLAVAYLLWLNRAGEGALGQVDATTHLLVLSAGVITAVPLLLFAYAARRIRFSTLGVLQYIAPTVQLAIGVWVYHEPFSQEQAMSFGLIWVGLLLYTFDNLWAQRRK